MKVENDVVDIIDSEDEDEVASRRVKVEDTNTTTTRGTPVNVDDRTRKRKVLEDELQEIEDEERLLELRQRKRPLQRDLALLEDDK